MKLKKILLWMLIPVPLLYLLLSLIIVLFVQSHDHAFIIAWYKQHWPNAFDAENLSENYFTISWYNRLRTNGVLLIVGIAASIIIYLAFIKRVREFFRQFLEECERIVQLMIQTFRNCSSKEKRWLWLLFGSIAAHRIYLYLELPFHCDELCSYLFYARQGTFMSVTTYTVAPNNHVFLNLVCSFLVKLPGLAPKFGMRLPVMMGDLVLLYGIFCLVRKWSNFQRAYFTVLGVAFCGLISFYAVQARGYQFQEICTVLSIVGCWSFFFSPHSSAKQGYAVFVVSGIIGFYVIPSFMYQFGGLVIAAAFLFVKDRDLKGALVFTKAVFLIVFFTFILYLPVILANSWDAVFNNQYVKTQENWDVLTRHWDEFLDSLNNTLNATRYSIQIVTGIFLLSVFLYYKGYLKGRFFELMLVCMMAVLISIMAITLYKKIYPYERALVFWVLIINIIFINLLFEIGNRLRGSAIVSILAVFIIAKVIFFSLRPLYWPRFAIRNWEYVQLYDRLQIQFDQLSKLGTQTWQITHSDDFYSMYVRLYIITHRLQDRVVFNRQKGMGDVIFLPDSVQSGFDLRGYTLWKDRQATAWGQYLSIYIKTGLVDK